MVCHLHVHSNYSFLHGVASPYELTEAAAGAGMPALALTDEGNLCGAVEFFDSCRSVGVQPVLGLELRVRSPQDLPPGEGVLVLLAMDLSGWGSLCRLTSHLQMQLAGELYPAVEFDRLTQESAGLICLTGGTEGLLSRWTGAGEIGAAGNLLGRLREVYPERLYVEIDGISPQEVDLAKRFRIPLVATHPVHYLRQEQSEVQQLLTAIRLNHPLVNLPADAGASLQAAILLPDELTDRFLGYPEALENSDAIASRCTFDLPVGQPQFPVIATTEGQSAMDVLRDKAYLGAKQTYGEVSGEILARLEHEIRVIDQSGYTPLFLVMEEIIGFARRRGVPASSRGSAASSLVAHCLGITSPDPLRLNLYFERFLNPARSSPPDIDTDLCSRRRDEVIEFVYDHFGRERVAMVCTVNRFRRRSALRETAKAFGLSSRAITELTDQLPHRYWGPGSRSGSAAPYADLAARYHTALYPEIFSRAEKLIGLPRHLSIHPGGMVIAPGNLTDLVPVQMASKGVVITQFDLDSISRLGLVKIDLLGIRGLTVLGDVADTLAGRSPGEYATPLEALESIPYEDAKTADLVRAGRTIGCFQIESPGMRATLREIGAHSVDDLMVALALYRPGPLTGGLKDAFVRRHRGLEASEHLHPALAPLLEDTYGVILYQEQVLRIAHELAGLDLADADMLRRAMSHFDPGEQMRTLKEKFLEGAASRSGVPEQTGERIWQLMAAFAGYGFPKAHAASYAQVSWRAAWCKTHEPAVFMAAVLANWGGYYGQRVYLTEARRLGLAVRAPHINYSLREFTVVYLDGLPVLFMGLDQVRDLTRGTQVRILRERPFRSLEDFLTRANPRSNEAENLIQAGALEGLGTIPDLLVQLHKGYWRRGQLQLFSQEPEAGDDWSLEEKMAAQQAVLGASVIADPLELFVEAITNSAAVSTLEAAGRVGQRLRVADRRQTWQRLQSAKGGMVHLFSLEDLEGMIEVVVDDPVYRRFKSVFSGNEPIIVEGEVILDPVQGEPAIRAERAWRLER